MGISKNALQSYLLKKTKKHPELTYCDLIVKKLIFLLNHPDFYNSFSSNNS